VLEHQAQGQAISGLYVVEGADQFHPAVALAVGQGRI